LGNDVSIGVAEAIYGVVVRDGAVDEQASIQRRADIRSARSQWPVEATLETRPDDNGHWAVKSLVGDRATFAEQDGQTYFRCDCGHAFAPAGENWKRYARRALVSAEDLGPRVKLHVDLEAESCACPSCARIHSVEIKLKGEAPLWDIELAL